MVSNAQHNFAKAPVRVSTKSEAFLKDFFSKFQDIAK